MSESEGALTSHNSSSLGYGSDYDQEDQSPPPKRQRNQLLFKQQDFDYDQSLFANSVRHAENVQMRNNGKSITTKDEHIYGEENSSSESSSSDEEEPQSPP